MLKSLSLFTAVMLSGVQLGLAQTTNPQPLASHVENAASVSGDNDRAVSPEAAASARKLYKEAVMYGRGGLFSQAVELFQRAIKLKPDYADAYFGLGHAYFDLGHWQEAIQSLQKGLELNPKDKQARLMLTQAEHMVRGENGRSNAAAASLPEPQQPNGDKISLTAPPLMPAVSRTTVSANEAALSKTYRVGPGDVLDVRLGDVASVRSTLFTITPSGLLEHPILTDPLPVAGLTVEEIGARLEDDLKRRALSNNPKVSVAVRDYLSHAILVSGLVKEAGTKILRREAIPLYVVVADAQPLPEAARAVLVRNESSDVYMIDLAKPEETSLMVHPGDVITVQANPTQFFYVGGEVKAPGEKTYRRGLTLTQAVIAAGGLTGKSGEARLARDNGKGFLVVTRYKLKEIDSGKIPDPLIQPGDRITIMN